MHAGAAPLGGIQRTRSLLVAHVLAKNETKIKKKREENERQPRTGSSREATKEVGGGGEGKRARAVRFVSLSSFLRADHLGDKVDDGGGRLLGLQLGKEVADVVRCASLLASHKAKEPGEEESKGFHLDSLSSPTANRSVFH